MVFPKVNFFLYQQKEMIKVFRSYVNFYKDIPSWDLIPLDCNILQVYWSRCRQERGTTFLPCVSENFCIHQHTAGITINLWYQHYLKQIPLSTVVNGKPQKSNLFFWLCKLYCKLTAHFVEIFKSGSKLQKQEGEAGRNGKANATYLWALPTQKLCFPASSAPAPRSLAFAASSVAQLC